MACTGCSGGEGNAESPRGCKNNGTCGTDGCNRNTVFDWLANMVYPEGYIEYNIYEVGFKNRRKEFYVCPENLNLSIGDVVTTEAQSGYDVGIITLRGVLVKVQMKKRKIDPESDKILKIYRKSTQRDIDLWQKTRAKEEPIKVRAREIAISHKLEMKISDVELQADGSKVIFYYTANERVDFRQLIKDFAREFGLRIEMKQVGFRQEAARLGGIGSCGRELCCSTWMTDFRSVNTSAARYQQLSLNPQKLAGQCGKLKCCLNFELDVYLDALKDFPETDTKLVTEKGLAICQKIDIFKRQMWFSYETNSANWFLIKLNKINEILDLNKKGTKIKDLADYAEVNDKEISNITDFEDASISRFDQIDNRVKNNNYKDRKTDKRRNTKLNNINSQENKRVQNKQTENNNKKNQNKPQNGNNKK